MFKLALACLLAVSFTVPIVAAPRPKPGRSTEVKVLVLNFDPITDPARKTRLHQEYRWHDPRELAEQYASDVEEASGGLIQFKVVGWEDLDEFPVKKDGFRYTVNSYRECRASQAWHQPDGTDYPAVIAKYKLAERVEQGEFDEVWWFGGPYFGFFESAMAGRNAFSINGQAYDAPQVKCKKAFAIMGFNYERGPAEMIHNLCHRTEATMSRVFGGWEGGRLDSDWARFAANTHQTGSAGVGTCHYPANGTSDYDYGNKRFVESTADDWLNYPELTGKKKQVNCETWGGPDYQRNYLKWWFARLPRAAGINPANGRLNNWWEYVFRFNEYDARGKQPLPSNPQQERKAALTVLQAGGKVNLRTSDDRLEVTDYLDLPAGEFEVIEVHLAGRPFTAEQLAQLNHLPRLRHLDLGATSLTDAAIEGLTELPALDWLSLRDNRISDQALRDFSRFPELRYLELNSTGLTDSALKHLEQHPQLGELHLSQTAVTDAGVATLAAIPKLAVLSLGSTGITDAGLTRLARIKNLSKIWLNKTDTTEAGVKRLQTALPKLTINR